MMSVANLALLLAVGLPAFVIRTGPQPAVIRQAVPRR